MLVRLHTFIRSVLRKNRSAFVPPALITESINQASFDLWRELIQDFRTTGKQSDLLSAFKESSSPSVSNGTFTVVGKSQSVVAGISIIDSSSKEYPTPAKRPKYSILDCTSTRHYLNLEAIHWKESILNVMKEISPLNPK